MAARVAVQQTLPAVAAAVVRKQAKTTRPILAVPVVQVQTPQHLLAVQRSSLELAVAVARLLAQVAQLETQQAETVAQLAVQGQTQQQLITVAVAAAVQQPKAVQVQTA
jgi:hypothetical protein